MAALRPSSFASASIARAPQVMRGGAQRFSRPCRCSNDPWHSGLAPRLCRGASGFRRFGSSIRLAGRSLLRAHWRPNKSFKPKPLRGSVHTCCNCCRVGSPPFMLRFGLIPALGRSGCAFVMVIPSDNTPACHSSRGLLPRRLRTLRSRPPRPNSGAISASSRLGVARVKRQAAAGDNVGPGRGRGAAYLICQIRRATAP
jgi:hypothetical protein